MELDGIVAKMAQKVKQNLKTIVLPETEDVRVLKAASIILKEEIAKIILIGDENEIKALCQKENIDMPICQALYKIIYDKEDIKSTIRQMFTRNIKQEFEDWQ